MSYDGEYGAAETCQHDMYWRSCAICHRVGPRATKAQLQVVRDQDRREAEQRQQNEAAMCRLYEQLNHQEKAVAEALWSMTSYASKVKLASAVKRWAVVPSAIGEARGVCRKAKILTAALRKRRLLKPLSAKKPGV